MISQLTHIGESIILRTYTMQNLIPLPALIKPSQGTYTLDSDAAIFVRPDQEEIRLGGEHRHAA